MYGVGKTNASSWGNIEKEEDKSEKQILLEKRRKHIRDVDEKRRTVRGMESRLFDKETRNRRLKLNTQRESSNIDRKKRETDQMFLDVAVSKNKIKALEILLNSKLNEFKDEKNKFEITEKEFNDLTAEIKRDTDLFHVAQMELKKLNAVFIV